MGSVAVLTTSGDNDAGLEPVQFYRHYLYCDACGAFDLGPWESADRGEVERHARRLGTIASWATPFLLVPAWETTGIPFSLSLLAFFVTAMTFAVTLFAWVWGWSRARGASRWRFLAVMVPWCLAFLVPEWLGELLPGWGLAAAGAVVVAAALARRLALQGAIETLGMRCRGCGATYGTHTAFFGDLDANPRGLTTTDVPRPLGRSPFLVGRTVGPAPTGQPMSK